MGDFLTEDINRFSRRTVLAGVRYCVEHCQLAEIGVRSMYSCTQGWTNLIVRLSVRNEESRLISSRTYCFNSSYLPQGSRELDGAHFMFGLRHVATPRE